VPTRPIELPPPRPDIVFGVDFSGAARPADNLWIAQLRRDGKRFQLLSLDPASSLLSSKSLTPTDDSAPNDDRASVLNALVQLILSSHDCLWGIDFPFALPVDILPEGTAFLDQLRLVESFSGTATDFGRHCVQLSLARTGRMHVRRDTDIAARTPFDCYHYRIIHQTFHGMRDVLLPLARSPDTAISPMHVPSRPRRWVVEACPGSTLRRLGLPFQNYKQPAGGPLEPKRRHTRAVLYAALRHLVDIPAPLFRRITRNPGGDALDAVLAALGTAHSAEHPSPLTPQHRREGLVFF
jgi:hypothetical protein